MPPHCDSMDGPVVTAARRALEKEDVNLVLPYVKESASAELKAAFDKALRARKLNPAAREVADLGTLAGPVLSTALAPETRQASLVR